MIRFKRDDGSNYPECQDKKMKDVITLLRGSSPRPIVNYVTSDGSGVNWIKIGDMPKTGSLVTSVSEKITEEGAKKSRKVNIGDLILSNSMSFGKPYILGIEGYIHDGWFVIRDYEENFNRDYLCQLLASETVQHQYNSLSAGGVVQNISSDIVNSVKIKLPCLEEQQKIADFLSSVDDVITASEQEVAALEEQKKGVMQKIFSQEVRFKADDDSDYPEWKEKKLDSLFEYKNGNSFENALDENGQYFLISLNSIDRKGNLQKELKRVNEAEWFLEKNDIVMVLSDVGKGNFLGLCDIIPCNNAYVLNQRMGLLRAKENLNYIFMRNYINHNQKYFKSQGQGSAQLNISKGDVLKFQVKCPCLEEQQKIADFLSDFDTAIDLAKQELEQWKELKKGLLQQLFE